MTTNQYIIAITAIERKNTIKTNLRGCLLSSSAKRNQTKSGYVITPSLKVVPLKNKTVRTSQ